MYGHNDLLLHRKKEEIVLKVKRESELSVFLQSAETCRSGRTGPAGEGGCIFSSFQAEAVYCRIAAAMVRKMPVKTSSSRSSRVIRNPWMLVANEESGTTQTPVEASR